MNDQIKEDKTCITHERQENSPQKRDRKPEGERLVKRPKHRGWEDNIKVGLKIGCKDWP
jgi:hypothetical protein